MITILVIADDFTGALDSGVQLAKAGIKTLVTTDCNVDLSVDNEYQALVVDNETRHIPPEDAGDRVFKLAKQAQAKGIPYIYKKTDSTLRGNVGSELHALLRAAESGRVYFAPAFPKTGRTTENGIQYLRGIPLEQTAFAHDPIDPVKTGVISDIIACQAPGIPVRVVNVGDYAAVTPPDKPDIVVLDAKCDNDLKNIAHFLHGIDGLGVASGCAGLLEYYPQYMTRPPEKAEPISYRRGKTLLVSGSVNQVSIDQLTQAKAKGYRAITLTPKQKLDSRFPDSREGSALVKEAAEELDRGGNLIIQSIAHRGQLDDESAVTPTFNIPANRISDQVARNIGEIVARLIDITDIATLIVFGGDTLHSIMRAMQIRELVPVSELFPGVVMARLRDPMHDIQIITKAGGFGESDLISRIDGVLCSVNTTNHG